MEVRYVDSRFNGTEGDVLIRRLFTHTLHPVFHILCIVMKEENLFKLYTGNQFCTGVVNLYLAVTPSIKSNVTNNKNEPFEKVL